MFWDIVIFAGFFWIIMSIFSFLQSVQIRNIFKVLEPQGKVYFGRDAGFLRTKYIAFAAVCPDGTVSGARLLKTSRIITPAVILPLDDLVHRDLSSFEPSNLGPDAKKSRAVGNLIANFRKHGGNKK